MSQTLPEIFEAAVGKVSECPEIRAEFPFKQRALCDSGGDAARLEVCGSDMFWAEEPVLGRGRFGTLRWEPFLQHSPFPCKEPEHLRTNSEPVTPSEDDIAEAERLKTEGNLLWSWCIMRMR